MTARTCRVPRGVLLATLLIGTTLHAQVPQMISYQGRISVNGTNFDGTGAFRFALVDGGTNIARQATAAANLTGQFVTSVTVTDGGGGYTSAPPVGFTGGGGAGPWRTP